MTLLCPCDRIDKSLPQAGGGVGGEGGICSEHMHTDTGQAQTRRPRSEKGTIFYGGCEQTSALGRICKLGVSLGVWELPAPSRLPQPLPGMTGSSGAWRGRTGGGTLESASHLVVRLEKGSSTGPNMLEGSEVPLANMGPGSCSPQDSVGASVPLVGTRFTERSKGVSSGRAARASAWWMVKSSRRIFPSCSRRGLGARPPAGASCPRHCSTLA